VNPRRRPSSGDRLKSYTTDDDQHEASVAFITSLASAYLEKTLATLPPDAHILWGPRTRAAGGEGDGGEHDGEGAGGMGGGERSARLHSDQLRGAIDHWYRLASLGEELTRAEAQCRQPYATIVVARLDNIVFDAPTNLSASLFAFPEHNNTARPESARNGGRGGGDAGGRRDAEEGGIFVQRPLHGTLLFDKGLDFFAGARAQMGFVIHNLAWSFGSLVWDLAVPELWHQQAGDAAWEGGGQGRGGSGRAREGGVGEEGGGEAGAREGGGAGGAAADREGEGGAAFGVLGDEPLPPTLPLPPTATVGAASLAWSGSRISGVAMTWCYEGSGVL